MTTSPAAPKSEPDRARIRPRRMRQEDFRRAQLVAATIESIAEAGFAATTVAAIAARAGVSTGLVAFYFGDKDGVLEASLRHLSAQLGAAVVAGLKAARTPRDRIRAVVEANLADAQFDSRLANVWLAFWAEVAVNPRFRRVQRVYERRMISTLTHAFRLRLSRAEAQRLAEATAALIDGLWLRATLSTLAPDARAARETVMGFVDTQLALVDLALLRPLDRGTAS